MVRDGLRFAAPALSRNPKTFPFYNPEKVQTRTNPFSCSLPLRGEGWGGGLRFAQFDQPAKLQTRRANPKSYALPPAPALASAPALSRNPKSYKPLFLLPPTPWGGLGRGPRFAQFDQPAKLQTRRANPKSYALPPAPALAPAPALSRNPKSYTPLFLLPPTPWGGLGRGAAVRSVRPTRKVTRSPPAPALAPAPALSLNPKS